MNEKIADVTVLLDRSGSMSTIKKETETQVRRYLDDRADDGMDVRVSLIQFDDHYEPVFEDAKAGELPAWTYEPRGWTALLDAMGKAIVQTGARLRDLPEALRPSKVVFVVMTDGEENWSREYTRPQIRKMIEEQTDTWKWQFIFLGVGIDAFKIARGLGYAGAQTMSVGHNDGGTIAAYSSASAATRRYVGGQQVNTAFTSKEFDEADATGGVPNAQARKEAKP